MSRKNLRNISFCKKMILKKKNSHRAELEKYVYNILGYVI